VLNAATPRRLLVDPDRQLPRQHLQVARGELLELFPDATERSAQLLKLKDYTASRRAIPPTSW